MSFMLIRVLDGGTSKLSEFKDNGKGKANTGWRDDRHETDERALPANHNRLLRRTSAHFIRSLRDVECVY